MTAITHLFESAYKAAYDAIVERGPSVTEAVAALVDFQGKGSLTTPHLYASTAITSAGFKRDSTLDFAEVVRLNNLTAALIMTELVEGQVPGLGPTTVMLPTELGKVPGWKDSHYLLFYFCWLAGLDARGTAYVESELNDPVRAGIVVAADDRKLPNEQRWPSYRVMVEILLANIALAEAVYGRPHAHARTLVKLVDTEESLGCRAEQMFADARGLDSVAVSLDGSVGESLRDLTGRLAELGAKVGIPRTAAQLVPLRLR